MAFPGCDPKLHPPTCTSFSFSHILTNPSWPMCAGALGSLNQMFGTDAWKKTEKRHLLEIPHLLNFWSITQATVIVQGGMGVLYKTPAGFSSICTCPDPPLHAGAATPLLRPSKWPLIFLSTGPASSPGSGLPSHLALPSSQHRSLIGLLVPPAHQVPSPQGLALVASLPGKSLLSTSDHISAQMSLVHGGLCGALHLRGPFWHSIPLSASLFSKHSSLSDTLSCIFFFFLSPATRFQLHEGSSWGFLFITVFISYAWDRFASFKMRLNIFSFCLESFEFPYHELCSYPLQRKQTLGLLDFSLLIFGVSYK